MRYFQLTATFTKPNGSEGLVQVTEKCNNEEYDTVSAQAILLTRVMAKRMNEGSEPVITHVFTELTNAEYNKQVKVPSDEIVYDEQSWEPELAEEIPPEVIPE